MPVNWPRKAKAAGVLCSVLTIQIFGMKQEGGIKHPSAACSTLLQKWWGRLWLSLEAYVLSSLTQSNGVIQPKSNTPWEFDFDQRIASLRDVKACHLPGTGESCRCPDEIKIPCIRLRFQERFVPWTCGFLISAAIVVPKTGSCFLRKRNDVNFLCWVLSQKPSVLNIEVSQN